MALLRSIRSECTNAFFVLFDDLMVTALKQYKNGFRSAEVLPLLEDEHAFEDRFGYKEFSERARLARDTA